MWSDSGGDFGGGGGHRHSGLREGDHVRGTQGHDRLRADQGPRPQTTEHSDPHRAPLGTGQVAQPHPLREVHARGCAAHGQPSHLASMPDPITLQYQSDCCLLVCEIQKVPGLDSSNLLIRNHN